MSITNAEPTMQRWFGLTIMAVAVVVAVACAPTAEGPGMEPRAISNVPAATQSIVETPKTTGHAPLFAYYYIWFDKTSWDRAKFDYPRLGRYSSDDEAVMRQHVRWAKEAGIDGFIVGWKSTKKLNTRLEKILRIADEESFGILMVYQALDFERSPLTVNRISADLDEFLDKYAHHSSLRVFTKPVVIWSGTWKYSPRQVDSVTKSRRDRLLILGTAKNVKDYQRIAGSLDGNAYYWSSVNVDTNTRYETKLGDMAAAIHKRNGLWIAPAAPGFDARLVGGTQIIDRKNGETLHRQLDAASRASPDIIGLISWNEFSENSHVEPSENFGTRYLDILKEFRQTLRARD